MMSLTISSSLRFRYLVLALGLVLTWFGIARLRDVPVDVFPEFAPPRVEIQTICLGLSPAEVEQLVTVPLENALNGVPGSVRPRANSRSIRDCRPVSSGIPPRTSWFRRSTPGSTMPPCISIQSRTNFISISTAITAPG